MWAADAESEQPVESPQWAVCLNRVIAAGRNMLLLVPVQSIYEDSGHHVPDIHATFRQRVEEHCQK